MDTTQIEYNGQFTADERRAMTAQMLQELRKAKKLSQKEVAACLKIPATTYNTYESGRSEPPIEILVRLSYLYQTPIDIIVQRDRTFRTAEDVGQQVKDQKAMLAEIDKQIAESGADNPALLALRETMEKLADAMLAYSQDPKVQKAIDKPTTGNN